MGLAFSFFLAFDGAGRSSFEWGEGWEKGLTSLYYPVVDA